MHTNEYTLEAIGRLLMQKTAGEIDAVQFEVQVAPLIKEAANLPIQRSLFGNIKDWAWDRRLRGAGQYLMDTTAEPLKQAQREAAAIGKSTYSAPGFLTGARHRLGNYLYMKGMSPDMRAAGLNPHSFMYGTVHGTPLDTRELNAVITRQKNRHAANLANQANQAQVEAAQNAAAAANGAQQAQGNGVVENNGMRIPAMSLGNAALGAVGLLGAGAFAHKKMLEPPYPDYPRRPMIMMM